MNLMLSPDRVVNVRGGAVALGYPMGTSRVSVLTTLIHALEDTIATLCIGAGEAQAMLERL